MDGRTTNALMKLSLRKGQAGVTLIELLVVIVIIAIVAGIALMNRGSADPILKRQNAAIQLKNAFERARFDSVKRRAASGAVQAKVTVTPTSYTLTVDRNMDGALTSADDITTNLPTGVVIALYPSGTLVSQEVKFNMRGETPTSPSPQFYVCNASCSSPSNGNANIVVVTPTGTVNLLSGGATLPSYGIPTLQNINTSSAVSNTVVVN